MSEAATSLRDTLESEFDKIEQTENLSSPAETVSAPDKARDDKGRFAKQEAENKPAGKPTELAQTETIQDVKTETTEPQPAKRKAYSSWKKEAQELLDQLIPSDPKYAILEQEIERRESDFHNGMRGYKEKATQLDSFNSQLDAFPFVQELKRAGGNPFEALNGLLTTEHFLRYGTPGQKVAALQDIINVYRIDVSGSVQPEQLNPQMLRIMQENNELKRRQSYSEEESITAQLEEFKKNAPHFEAVRETMRGLLQGNLATDFQTAYEKALRFHPEIQQQDAAQQRAEQERIEREKAINAAKIAKSKATSIHGGASVKTTQATSKNIRDILESQVDKLSSGGRI